MIPKTIAQLFEKEKEMDDLREFVITCSMYEIYLDKVRDLGSAFIEKSGINISSKSGLLFFNKNKIFYQSKLQR